MGLDKKSARSILLGFAYALIGVFSKTKHLSGAATALECMDYRVHGATRKWAKRNHHVRGIDLITQKGMVKILAENKNTVILANIADHLWTSFKDHGSRVVIIALHGDCAGNRVKNEEQIAQSEEAEKTVRQMIRSMPLNEIGITSEDITIDRLWVDEETWMPKVISLGKRRLKVAT